LALFLTVAEKSPQAKRVQGNVEQLTTAKYPVILRQHQDDPRSWTTDELAELVRWIDTLDRL
jgi:hypothetical protein